MEQNAYTEKIRAELLAQLEKVSKGLPAELRPYAKRKIDAARVRGTLAVAQSAAEDIYAWTRDPEHYAEMARRLRASR